MASKTVCNTWKGNELTIYEVETFLHKNLYVGSLYVCNECYKLKQKSVTLKYIFFSLIRFYFLSYSVLLYYYYTITVIYLYLVLAFANTCRGTNFKSPLC